MKDLYTVLPFFSDSSKETIFSSMTAFIIEIFQRCLGIHFSNDKNVKCSKQANVFSVHTATPVADRETRLSHIKILYSIDKSIKNVFL